jgi:uncharacterized small protein (DUF1192 family)
MFDDELTPQKQKPKPRDLTPLSVDELYQLIDDLKAEIIRAEAEIARKKTVAEAAASFFKKP